ncbi:MAG: magnesium/cobalt transporter CorA [Gammaproteobacteria bacterium]|jgi:magnesium transporter|uniref:Magnesium transport protein CorA n=1 Tax=Marinomonas polaris DSM 16579 TaxID=1122206 RepID=A0A1M5HB69_9GAMM|nr:magnesium/cobalt transporter CorA [Marinomonas polaris]MBU1294309.1 magnesium/cobalt transporter CorA [Gammaproteobacteria bacterium]MBU1466537.1 magnesium/cobalt transporter CorA [Gammaproteobacteria bacterium]MBU2239179.1 magnesium/cobalt transporter CorA [Gammaproteobacteria bacterium]MBU2317323.1 magnesium/cobalt transporter CorA [Gammaproteobacteria bacterium]MBU2411432.1 magnesium/cobalt transporter CorA [Gammaproteobacteria bacterium]|tara:strand:- start:3686 stop:4639 length:954 start_codon:yes stop_codon:yes gene_type:complete
MLKFFKIRNGLIQEISKEDENLTTLQKEANWIDAAEPDDDDRLQLKALLRTDLPESDDVEEIEASARCFVDQAGIHVHSLFLNQTEGRHKTSTVACILQQDRLITIRETELADFRLLRMRARRGQIAVDSPAHLLVTLLENKVENHADALEDLHRQLEEVSHLVLEDNESELDVIIEKLARLEDSNGKIRLCLMDTQRNISFLLRHLPNRQDYSETLREVMRDVETLMSHTTFLFDKINFLMDSTQGFINIEQNKIIKIFSIASVVFLPPTLVASIYGMNFKIMPELDLSFGYPAALGLMVFSAFAPYWYFKHRGWL